MLIFDFGLKVICQFGLGHWHWSRGVQICNFSSIFNFLQGRHSAFLIRLVLKVLILDWAKLEIIIEIKFILENIMGIMFLIRPLNSPGQSSLLQCGKLICNFWQKCQILSDYLIVFSLRMFMKKKFNHVNLSADVLLISVSVTFADGVQPLELGDRPTNYFGHQDLHKDTQC